MSRLHVLRPARERGSAMLGVAVAVVICAALAFGALIPSMARHREAQALVQRERAFQVAEAGIDWSIASVRAAGAGLTLPSSIAGTPGSRSGGAYAVALSSGDTNLRDDDGDGVIDNADEAEFVQVQSTGTVGSLSRTIRVMLRRSVTAPTIGGAIQFNVANPILDLNGNAFFISGADHALDGTEDAFLPEQPGIAAPTLATNLSSQIPAQNHDQVVGLGTEPSVDQVAAIDLGQLVAQARAAATHTLTGGTHSNVSLGTATPDGVVVAVATGDIKFTGTATGAGVLVVDGDLDASGQFEWTGIVIVRGRVNFTGGGTGKRIVGSLIVGEEVSAHTDSSEIRLTGTVDLLFSSTAVELAQQKLATLTVLSWQETANP